MAGASLVGVCTAALLQGPGVYGKIAMEAAQWLEKHHYQNFTGVKGMFLEKFRSGQKVVTEITKTAQVDESLCRTCTLCEKVCQFDAISAPGRQVARVDNSQCTACGLCVSICPAGAISLQSR